MTGDFYALAKALMHELGMTWIDRRTGERHDPPAIIQRLAKEFPLAAPIGIEGVMYYVCGYKVDGRLIVSADGPDATPPKFGDQWVLDIEALRAGRIVMERAVPTALH